MATLKNHSKYTFILSKSSYLSGKQCEKKLYLYKKHRELATPRSKSEEAIMQQGTSMGEVAQLLLSNGKDASPEKYWDYGPSIAQTKAWIEAGEATIYEAAFSAHQVMAALDILHHKNGKRIAIEVKSSTSVKEYHLDDAALQYWVMKEAGYTPDVFYIMHIDNTYVREGKIKVAKLFHLEDVTPQILEKQADIPAKIEGLKTVLQQDEIPEKTIGPHCTDPFVCEFMEHCWKHVPDGSVFELARIGKRAWEYYDQGILKLEDLPETDPFNEFQQLQIRGAREAMKEIRRKEIMEFLDCFHYPLYFFDFETINPALPPYDGCRPYQQLGVQYSLHILKEDGSLEHRECLPKSDSDPRKELIEQMLIDLSSSAVTSTPLSLTAVEGSIVAYNMSFEKRVIAALAEAFPEYRAELTAMLVRFVDLIIPFRNGWYYSPDMKGSASIKSVLPALFKNDQSLNYDSLRISNGGDASVYLQAYFEGRIKKADEDKVREDLLAYCKLDTLAMVKIYQKLRLL